MLNFTKTNITSLLLLLLTISCGQNHGSKDRSIASLGEEFTKEIASLDPSSQSIALRICNSLRSKRSYWHTQPIVGKQAKISVYDKSCRSTGNVETETISARISSTLLSNPIVFDTLQTTSFLKEVITDVHGPLKTVCPSIFSADAPLEFFADGDDRVYTQFSKIDDSTDRLTLKYAEVNSNDQQEVSGYKVFRIKAYDIKTKSSDSTYLGTVSEINESESCEDERVTTEFKQTLDAIL